MKCKKFSASISVKGEKTEAQTKKWFSYKKTSI